VATVTPSWSLDPGHILLELDPIEARRKDSEELVRYAGSRLSEAGFETTELILEGHPGGELLAEIKRGGYDVVVVGSGSHSWAGHRLFGSVSTLLLHEAPCSVVVTHEFSDIGGVRRALVAVDGSQDANQAVRLAAMILDPGRVQLQVLSVAALHIPVAVPNLTGSSHPEETKRRAVEEHERDRALRHATAAARTLQDAGFEVTSKVETGGVGKVILEKAREGDSDLVIVGCRGLGPVRRALLGSVSDQLARLAPATLVGRISGI
jgi:nucleotide-binding universal stress UspA family protein